MECELDYCVYNAESACILDEIHINSVGMCEECEIAAVPKVILDKHKKMRLQQLGLLA